MSDGSESAKARKRRRDEDIEAETERDGTDQIQPLDENITFSDTFVALQVMRAQFPHIDKVAMQPFILQSQLYSSLKERTEVDRELESLRREKVLRIFKLNTGQDDHAIMFLEDYQKQMERVILRFEEQKHGEVEVFGWFKTHVIDHKLEPSIGHEELYRLLSLGGKVKDEHISLLIHAGLLIRQLIDPNMYWFAIPNIGSILKGLSQGRKELLSLLNRSRYKEMPVASLEKKRLRLSPLDMSRVLSCILVPKEKQVSDADAEGRLTLADALLYPCNQIVDLATLTAACVVALGASIAGNFDSYL